MRCVLSSYSFNSRFYDVFTGSCEEKKIQGIVASAENKPQGDRQEKSKLWSHLQSNSLSHRRIPMVWAITIRAESPKTECNWVRLQGKELQAIHHALSLCYSVFLKGWVLNSSKLKELKNNSPEVLLRQMSLLKYWFFLSHISQGTSGTADGRRAASSSVY